MIGPNDGGSILQTAQGTERRESTEGAASLVRTGRRGSSRRPAWDIDAAHFEPEAVRAAFEQWGIVVLRDALDSHEVARLRRALDEAFEEESLRGLPLMVTRELIRREPIWRPMFEPCSVAALKAALGEPLYYQNDMDVQRNYFHLIRWTRCSGWHFDAISERDQPYLFDPHYRFAKCGFFLQDFDNGWGGGIRIKPLSHRAYTETRALPRTWFRWRNRAFEMAIHARVDFSSFNVPTRAGDFCFFDSRLLHASTPWARRHLKAVKITRRENAKRYWPDVPREHTKYVIYWDACPRGMVQDFLENSVRRAALEPEGMQETSERRAIYTGILAFSYPQDFPADFVAAARAHGVEVASLPPDHAAHYVRKLATVRIVRS